ncbi:MAG: hypothetical protein AAF206_15450 [Bacteroidota bacterium]
MKSFFRLFICLFLLFPFALQAQITKGHYVAGGNLNMDFFRILNTANIQFTTDLDLSVAYFVSDGLALGVSFPFSYYRSAITRLNVNELRVGLGPLVRWFPGKQEGLLNWYLNGQFGMEAGSNTFLVSRNNVLEVIQLSGVAGFVAGGIGTNVFINSQLAVDLNLSYSYPILRSDSFANPQENLAFRVGLVMFWEKK